MKFLSIAILTMSLSFRSHDRPHLAFKRRPIPRHTLRHHTRPFRALNPQNRLERQGRLHQTRVTTPPHTTNPNLTSTSFQCPQTFPSSASGGPLPGDITPPISSEFGCLILQLAIPLSLLQDPIHAAKLPVLVYFHGGGFVLGGASRSLFPQTEAQLVDCPQASTNNTIPRCSPSNPYPMPNP